MTIYEARYAVEEIAEATELTPDFRAAYATWQRMRGDAALPSWSVMHFLDFPQKLLPLAVLAVRHGETDDFRIRYWGSRRYDLHREDYTGCLVSEVGPPCVGEKLAGEYAEVVRAGRPLKAHSFLKSHSQGDIHFYKLRLPFAGAAADGVGCILSLDDPCQLSRRLFMALAGQPAPSWVPEERPQG